MKLSDREKFARELAALQRALHEAWRANIRVRRAFDFVRSSAEVATKHSGTPLAGMLTAELERFANDHQDSLNRSSRVDGAVDSLRRFLGIDTDLPKPRRARRE